MVILGIEILCVLILAMILSTTLADEKIKRTKDLRPVKLRGYWEGDERRTAKRLDVSLEVKYYIDGKLANVKSVDVSTKGIRLILDEKLEEGVGLRLEIRVPKHTHIIKATGEIVWSKEAVEDEKGQVKRLFNTGIKFLKFNRGDEAELFDFIHSFKS